MGIFYECEHNGEFCGYYCCHCCYCVVEIGSQVHCKHGHNAIQKMDNFCFLVLNSIAKLMIFVFTNIFCGVSPIERLSDRILICVALFSTHVIFNGISGRFVVSNVMIYSFICHVINFLISPISRVKIRAITNHQIEIQEKKKNDFFNSKCYCRRRIHIPKIMAHLKICFDSESLRVVYLFMN